MNSIKNSNKLLMLKVTNRCNNNCIFCCDKKEGENIQDLNIDRVKDLFHRKGRFETVHIIGGEPTFYPKIIELSEFIDQMGCSEIYLETNATNLSSDFIKALINNNLRTFVIGFHSISNKTYYKLTGNKKGLEQSINNIQKIIELGGKVILNIAVQVKNYKTINSMINEMQKLGVKDFIVCSIIPPIYQNYSFEEIVPKYTDVYPFLRELFDVKKDINISLQYFPYCVIKDLINYRLDNNQEVINYMDVNGDLVSLKLDWTSDICIKNEDCAKCIHTKQCNGVFKEYISNIGWREFSPILN